MRKIDTWLFIVFFLAAYTGIFIVANVTLFPVLSGIFISTPIHVAYCVGVILFMLICFVSAFGVRSYYALPTSVVRLVSIIVLLQLSLNALSAFFKQPTLTDVGTWLVTAVSTWVVLYGSFYLSDKYFTTKK